MVLKTLSRMLQGSGAIHFDGARTTPACQIQPAHEKYQVAVDNIVFPQVCATLWTLWSWHVAYTRRASAAHRVDVATDDEWCHFSSRLAAKQLHANLTPIRSGLPCIRVRHNEFTLQ